LSPQTQIVADTLVNQSEQTSCSVFCLANLIKLSLNTLHYEHTTNVYIYVYIYIYIYT